MDTAPYFEVANAQAVLWTTCIFAVAVCLIIVYTTLAQSRAARLREAAWALVPVLIVLTAATPAVLSATGVASDNQALAQLPVIPAQH